MPSAEGRGRVWTQFVHGSEVHQTTPYTEDDRYPELFDLAATLFPAPERILSFGCSTGEELLALRFRFPDAQIVGAEINPHCRRLALQKMSNDPKVFVVRPDEIQGRFDMIFALAVLQRQPHLVSEANMANVEHFYPFARFDAAVCCLVDVLRPAGLLCVMHALYRVEDSSASTRLQAIATSPPMMPPLYGPDGQRVERGVSRSVFRKRPRPEGLAPRSRT